MRCQCSDPGCPVGHGSRECGKRASATLYRVDMDDETGTDFCDECADDAMESGVFTDEDDEDDEEVEDNPPSDAMLALYVATNNDTNGNPRRGWIIVGRDGSFVGFVDEGYRGTGALKHAGVDDLPKTGRLEVTPGEYRALKRELSY